MCCNRNAMSQRTSSNEYVLETHHQKIWIPSKLEETYEHKAKDTLKKVLDLAFEQAFDDSVYIKVNDSIVYKKRIKTDPKLSVVKDDFIIDYSVYKDIPSISIFLVEKKKFIRFKPALGYRHVYLSRLQESWELNFSNYPRFYY